ncbi:MAG: ABC transporter ATP-binding protein [Bacteroidales bacterium]|nr:ABC transporter ATP-binding protein [Lachnoclostridium sp.]MCM1385673.1 ABC transporter ATP-binding protein [Lachnoclostridium sp.]MCM1466444.1 ABC transporter ATP-binding protein [Bacteroidales bacterium]
MIKIEDLTVAFSGKTAVENVNLTLQDGEILGVVGESGSGKSVTALTLMGLLNEEAQIVSGRIFFDSEELLEAGKAQDKELYRKYQGAKMSMVFQEPMTSLNPTQRVGKQAAEMLELHTSLPKEEIYKKVLEVFASVGLRDVETVYASYPHQLSGGMRQRVMIAMAVILHPRLIVADEPTTALDVTIQNQIIELLAQINKEQKNTMLFITHDLNLARRICHRIAVMKDGKVVEIGDTEEVFLNPKEEYTKKLIEAVPSRMKKRKKAQMTITEEGHSDSSVPILEVHDLNVYYQEGSNSLFGRDKKRRVVENATFDIKMGEIMGLVGESGCGKTSLSKAILGMNKDIRGEVVSHSKGPQMIFQDPYSSLNPAKTIGWLLQEPLRARGRLDASQKMSSADMEAAAYEMLEKVGMEEYYFHRKPSQLSGGQRQRVSIGQALITRPRLVIADEPVSALDVTLQAQIMELMRSLQEELHLSYLFISHDINVIYQMSDRIMVMQKGRIVEIGDTEEVFGNPKEEYTKLLLAESVPAVGQV